MGKVYNDEDLAKRVFLIVMCGVLIEIVVMFMIGF